MNMQICTGEDCINNTWPILKPVDLKPKKLVTFLVADSHEHKDDYCHFFIDDYRFERLWDRPERYIEILKRYAGVIAPDFSTYTDMPYPMQAWNVYRSRALAHYWQKCGINVIPNIQFSDPRSYEWFFDGLPYESTLASSTVGLLKREEWRNAFAEGMEEAIRRTRPKRLIIYGKAIPFDHMGVEVKWYKNDNTARVRKAQREKERARGRNKNG